MPTSKSKIVQVSLLDVALLLLVVLAGIALTVTALVLDQLFLGVLGLVFLVAAVPVTWVKSAQYHTKL